MPRLALPCIACGRELRNVEETATNQPYGGTSFITYGHYGSTVYDPMDGHYLEVNICDLCLSTHADRVYEGRDHRPVVEEGSVTEMEKVTPLALVHWYVDRKCFDHVVEQARKEFELVSDEE